MKNIVVDASAIANADDPVLSLSKLYNLNTSNWEELFWALSKRMEYTVTYITNWPQNTQKWQEICELLESVQQHSSWFFLIWGTKNNMVNVQAKDQADLLKPFDAEEIIKNHQ